MTVVRIACLCFLVLMAGAAELTVGSGKMYAKPSLAAAVANNGDTISIDAGTYTDDVCTWSRSNLVLRGVGGMAHLAVSYNVVAGGKAIWVLSGSNITVQNMEFSGAAIPGDGTNGSQNAAGIRAEGAGLTISGCYFHDNQNGILASGNAGSDMVVENSEFAYNGAGDGYTHNLYIGAVRSLTFRWNYSHHTKVGHNLKTRALANYIIANRIMDEATGTSSRVVDIPQGGLTFLIGNLIQQGPATQNHSLIIDYAEEGAVNPSQHLYVSNNTIVNDYTLGGTTYFLNIAATTTVARVENNIFLGSGTAINGPTTSNLNNLITTTSPLVNRAGFDYHLAAASAAIDAAVDPGIYEGQALLPTSQYVHARSSQSRTTSGAAPDIGAYEYVAANVAPVITEGASTTQTVTEDIAGSTTLHATDANGDTLTWSILSQGSKGVAAASGTGAAKTVSYTPTANLNGADTFVVQVADGNGGSDTITVNVTITAVNDAPVLAVPIPDQSATVGVAFSYTVPLGSFTDVEGTTLTWSSNEALGWLSFNTATRAFTGTPGAGDVAATTITVTASDGSLTASDSFVLTVVTAPNLAPVITEGASTTLTVTEDIAGSITLHATDANGDTLTWSILSQGSKGVAAASGTGAAKSVSYSPTANLNGADSFVVQVADGNGGSDTITVNVTITAVNDAPVLAVPIPDQSATVGVAFSYTVPLGSFTDIEGTTLSWSSNEALSWLSFNTATRAFTGTPGAGDVAATTITVTASDGSLTASDSFVLTVGAAANAVPVVASASATPATVSGTSTVLACSASDDGGEPSLIYTWSASGPAAVAFSPNGTHAAKAATATFIQSGSYVLTVTARDAGGLDGTRTVSVSVAATPTSMHASPAAVSVAVGAQAAFSASVSDQFGIVLAPQPTVTWAVAGGGSIDVTGLFTASTAAGGPWSVTATAGALSDIVQVTVTASAAGGGSGSGGGGGGGGGCGAGAGAAGLLLVLPLACFGRRRRVWG